jgi:carbon-monoxide dehydrogenase large subunit
VNGNGCARKYVGAAVPRLEDRRLILGRGRYTDDEAVPGALFAVVVRSPHAHARLVAIRAEPARNAPGVAGVFTAADYLADGRRPIRQAPVPADNVDPKRPAFEEEAGATIVEIPQDPLAIERVRYVGEAVAFVVARSLAQARDAAELIEVEYDELPAVVDARAALEADAPQLWEAAPGNLVLDAAFGDAAATEKAFARAALVLEREFFNQRIVSVHMEPRAAIGAYDAAREVYTLIAGGQGVARHRVLLAEALGVEAGRVEVVCHDVGGGFGSRNNLHPEAVLVAWAAQRLGAPVRWTSDRSEGFLTDFQGRDIAAKAALAFDERGTILAARITATGNAGASTVSYAPLQNYMRIATTVYAVPVAFVRVRCAVTNTTCTAPFRGAGRPEATFTMERLLDLAAKRLGIDRVEIRRRNLIPREALPYHTVMGLTYDSGDFAGNMERALASADWAGFPARKAASEKAGRLRGISVANYVESPVGMPRERVALRICAEGKVEVVAGTQSSGQGHETVFAQVVADQLAVPLESITLVTGDTRAGTLGGGSHSNRSMRLGGTLLMQACAELIEKARAIVADQFEAEPEAVAFEDGLFRFAPTQDALDIFAVASLQELTSTKEFFGRIPAFPTGCGVSEVEIDPVSGALEIVRYTQIDDVGQAVNPLIVHGQSHGGIAQGLGQAVLEYLPVDFASGQVLGGSFMDYAVPRAADVPRLDVELVEDPTAGNPLRVKGGGEGGITPSPAATIGAIVDALKDYGVEDLPQPATAPHIWSALHPERN